ncbi:MAG: efflux RND transporter periplasmic adaptor subunit [Ferruginibacter sp.]
MKPICTLLILLSLSVTSCNSGKEDKKADMQPAKKPPVKADVYVVAPSLLSQDLEVSGSLAAAEEVELHPDVSGRVTGVFFREGSYVSQGSTLLKLYDGDLQAQLQKLNIQLKTAQQTTARYEALLKIGGVSQQEYDMQVLGVNTIRADMEIVRTSISKTTLRAPFSGKIGITTITKGAFISPQTLVATLRRVSQLKLDFTVPEQYGNKMKPGASVDFTIEGNSEIYHAVVSATENIISQENRGLRIIANVSKPGNQLIAGAFAKVKVPLGDNNNALMIPTQSVIPDARNKKVILLKNGMASMEVVTLGFRDSARVEITSGLKAGDTILVTGLLTAKPGAKIQVNKIISN